MNATKTAKNSAMGERTCLNDEKENKNITSNEAYQMFKSQDTGLTDRMHPSASRGSSQMQYFNHTTSNFQITSRNQLRAQVGQTAQVTHRGKN